MWREVGENYIFREEIERLREETGALCVMVIVVRNTFVLHVWRSLVITGWFLLRVVLINPK